MAGSGETITYAELEARANQGAHLLRSLGLKRGDGIALMLENTPRFFEIVWAAQRAGLYYSCLSTRLAVPEIAFILADSGSRVLVASMPVPDDLPTDGITVFAPRRARFLGRARAVSGNADRRPVAR
ncbi:AMP-binding protein [Novosphingobium colocasiae]